MTKINSLNRELSEVKATNKNLSEQNRILQNEKSDKEKQIKDLKNEIDELNNVIGDLKLKNEKLENDADEIISNHYDDIDHLQRENEELKYRYSLLSNLDSSRVINDLLNDKERLLKENEDLKKENDQLRQNSSKKTTTTIKTTVNVPENLEKSLDELKDSILDTFAGLHGKWEETKSDIRTRQNTENTQLCDEIASKKKELNKLQADIKRLRKEEEDLIKSRTSKNSVIDDLGKLEEFVRKYNNLKKQCQSIENDDFIKFIIDEDKLKK